MGSAQQLQLATTITNGRPSLPTTFWFLLRAARSPNRMSARLLASVHHTRRLAGSLQSLGFALTSGLVGDGRCAARRSTKRSSSCAFPVLPILVSLLLLLLLLVLLGAGRGF